MSDYDGGRGQAKHLLKHYMAMFMGSPKAQVDSDNYAEWDSIIDCIMDGVKAEIKTEDKANTEKADEIVSEAIETIKTLQRDNQMMREQLQSYTRWWDDNNSPEFPTGPSLLALIRQTKNVLNEIYAERT